MSDYLITVEAPQRPRRGDNRLIVVVTDSQGSPVYRNRVDINEENFRTKVVERISQKTGDDPGDIDRRLLQGLAQLQPPSKAAVPEVSAEGNWPYEATPEGLIRKKETDDGVTAIPLTTFNALITGQALEDDGVETRRLLDMEATLRGRTYQLQVPANQFAGMNWPLEHMGAAAALWAGFGVKDHARTAIQLLSGDPPERRVYIHLGWRKIGKTWFYLHANGAIGPLGSVSDVEVALPSDLQNFALPEPPTGSDLVEAVRASLLLLEVAGDLLTFPTYCRVWRASLGGSDSGQHLFGPTGSGKSELAALAQQHFGAGLDARHLRGNWSSTDNALEVLAFTAKDALVVVDDFCPTGSSYDVQAMHRKADRLFRAQGNTSGRQRLRPDGSPRPVKPPRGMILSTGEDVPRGPVTAGTNAGQRSPKGGGGRLGLRRLTLCQKDAASGFYAQAMGGYIRWQAARYEEIQTGLKAQISQLREKAYRSGQHRRTPDIVANLAVGFRYFLDFAQDAGAVDQSLAEELWQRCWDALGEAAAAQGDHQADSEPVGRFFELLISALSSGRAHLAGPGGGSPDQPKAWGWREEESGTGSFGRNGFQPRGERIGWLDGGEIYLDPDAAYAAAQKLTRDEGDNLPVTLPTPKRRLKEQGLLASLEHSSGKERLVVRRTLEGRRRQVLHLKPETLSMEGSQVRQVRHDGLITESLDTKSAEAGSIIGAQTELPGPEVRQQSVPEEALTVSEDVGAGALGSLGAQIEAEAVADELFDEVLG